MRFVIHEHHARQLHYDFRLEIGNILKSWAIPKSSSLNPADKRLAVMVDDHLLEYYDFEGIITEGQYGSGAVVIWDSGTYNLLEGNDLMQALESGKIVMELHGNILKGGFALVQMKGRGENNWLLIKKKDKYSQEKWTLQKALTAGKKSSLSEREPPCSTK